MGQDQQDQNNQMNVHKNAKQTPRGRERLVRLVLSGLSPERASRLAEISPRALRKWVARFKADGVEGLMDRSSRPHHLRAVTPEPIVRRIISLRRLRWTDKQSPGRQACRQQQSAGCCIGLACHACAILTRPNRCAAMNAKPRAI